MRELGVKSNAVLADDGNKAEVPTVPSSTELVRAKSKILWDWKSSKIFKEEGKEGQKKAKENKLSKTAQSILNGHITPYHLLKIFRLGAWFQISDISAVHQLLSLLLNSFGS